MGYYFGVETGADYEFGARGYGFVCLIGGEDGAGAYEHLREFGGDPLDCFGGAFGSEGDFGDRKSSVAECLCERHCLFDVVYLNDRHNAV